jgi:hypothetical protein
VTARSREALLEAALDHTMAEVGPIVARLAGT